MDWTILNPIDWGLLAVVLLSAVGGWRWGFITSTLHLLTLAASLVIAFLAYPWPAAWMQAHWPALDVWLQPISFVLCFVLAHLALGAGVVRIARALPPQAHRHGLNRLLGLLPGTANGLINATVVALLLLTLPLMEGLSRMARESAFANLLSEPAQAIEARLSPIFDPAIRRSLQSVTVDPATRQRVDLPFRVTDARPRPDLEARMLEMVNAERAAHGLTPLKADPEVVGVARDHSRDMFGRGYFSHVTPEGATVGDRMRRANVRYLLAGENLALAQTLQVAHAGLMNSPGHRANILRPQFGRLGIGVLDGGARGLMVTQNFRN
ncbi:CvpA family protein [Ramlibacter tataouinensis]|uniref:Candidate membrane protein n=1 Tax=Ramlibacter tataouinensis (strain ATCC BAA-407 / DSM 14655 / LMG 21543 / TTB310) TaxID=365046 RepID=F5Y507_RAMTT|nr:CvpA family protein [Ramlibacter tataouinensis]AEG93847.1 candidate membrane protein [Ramlibacter tataouinensis TTB310]